VSDRCALARAVYEGVALNIRWTAEAFDRLAGSKKSPLRVVGGGATSLTWCQLIADVLQRPIEQVEEPALAGARGSAMTAALAIGWFPDLGAAARGMIRVARTFQPDQDVADLYSKRFAQFAGAYQNLSPWYRRHGEAVAQARGSDSE
jgi:xylulokinase